MIKKIEGLYNNHLEKIEEHTGWYYSFDDYVDLCEIEESIKYGNSIPGNEISFFTYPECRVFTPFKKEYGVYYENMGVKYFEGDLYFLQGDFNKSQVNMFKVNLKEETVEKVISLKMEDIDLYNIRISTSPIMIGAQNTNENTMEFYYPEKMTFSLDDNLSFAFRDGDRFYFSYWKEEGYDDDGNLVGEYKYYELYVVKDKSGNIIEKGIGYIERMPDGKYIIV